MTDPAQDITWEENGAAETARYLVLRSVALPSRVAVLSDATPAQAFAQRAAEAPGLALSVCEGDDDDGFALAAARGLARRSRTILVAMDDAIRMPNVAGPGLADLLTARATFDDTIHRDPISRLHVLGPGEGAQGGAEGVGVHPRGIAGPPRERIALGGDREHRQGFAQPREHRAQAVARLRLTAVLPQKGAQVRARERVARLYGEVIEQRVSLDGRQMHTVFARLNDRRA